MKELVVGGPVAAGRGEGDAAGSAGSNINKGVSGTGGGRETWTIRPDADVASMMKKAINRAVRAAKLRGQTLGRRGLRTRLLNEAFRAQYEHLRGKREGEGRRGLRMEDRGDV